MTLRVTKIVALIVCLAASHAFAQDATALRVQAAQQAYEVALADLDRGSGTAEDVYRWSRRWLEATKKAEGAAATDAHLARMEALQLKVVGLVVVGLTPESAEVACRYYVAEAKVWKGG
jgi:hypothetical protein